MFTLVVCTVHTVQGMLINFSRGITIEMGKRVIEQCHIQ